MSKDKVILRPSDPSWKYIICLIITHKFGTTNIGFVTINKRSIEYPARACERCYYTKPMLRGEKGHNERRLFE